VSWRRVVAWTGSVILAFGVLVLLFVAYDLWGTGISTRFHQEALRKQFNHELALARHQARATTTTRTTTAPGSPPTTQPIHGVVRATPGVPPADGQPIGTIDIPSIGVDYVVVQGTSTADLQLGPGHYDNTPLPGQPGNAAIAGHRTTYLHPFFNLNELVAGDPIYVTTTQGRFRYNVTTIMAVAPNDVAVVAPTPVPTLTLTTCNPRYSASQRLVVHGTLVSPPAPIPRATKAEIERAQDSGPDSVAAGLGGDRGSVWSTIWWGAGSVIFALAVWMLARRRHRLARISVVVVGSLVFLVLLFFFFQSVSPLLPASF
jgi:sortase A